MPALHMSEATMRLCWKYVVFGPKGHSWAENFLGGMYARGEGVQQDYEEAEKLARAWESARK